MNQSEVFDMLFRMDADSYFMREALKEAKIAADLGEVPIGAVLVFQDKIISRAHNLVESLNDASAHAELLALQQGAKALDNWRLAEATLYSTLEPCAMCAGAMMLYRVRSLVWGAPDFRHGADGSLFNILGEKHPIHQIEVRRGVLAEECGLILKDFFKERRACAKTF